MKLFRTITTSLIAIALVFGSFIYAEPIAPVEAATNAIETPVALFETSLANAISSSATSMTLVSGLTKNGTTLASSTYSFIIDEGTASEEFVIADCTSTACTNMTRGLSVLTGTTTVATLQKAHRRGASVKMTDAPLLLKLARLANGIMAFPNSIFYDGTIATTTIAADDRNLVNVELLNDTAFNGAAVITATETARGVVEIATGAEAGASTQTGGSGRLVLPASIATTTYNGSSSNVVVITDGTNKIDDDFIPSTIAHTQTFSSTLTAGTTTINGSLTLSGGNSTSNIASSSLQTFVASTSPSTTWTKPSNLKYVLVKVIGAGGGGGGKQNNGTTDAAGGGGGGGGYCEKIIPASALGTTETVVVPTGGSAGNGSTNGTQNAVSAAFGTHCTATNGAGGEAGGNGGSGGAGGSGASGDFNLKGGGGGGGGGASNISGGSGGSSMLGGGGEGTDGDGGAGGNYGGGGGGGGGSSGTDQNGGAGAGGAVFVYQYFY